MVPMPQHWHSARFIALMKNNLSRLAAVNWTVLAWAVGVPLPLVAIIALVRGCS